MKTM